MAINVKTHAVKRYAERVLGKEMEELSPEEVQDVRARIKEAVYNEDKIYNGEGGDKPIHIIGDAAVVVDKSDELNFKIPSVYHVDTFKDKMEA